MGYFPGNIFHKLAAIQLQSPGLIVVADVILTTGILKQEYIFRCVS